MLNNGGEFPAYVTRCIAAGISSVAAFPIKRGATTVAVLTITSADHHGFGTADLRVARDAAAAVERCLANTSATAR